MKITSTIAAETALQSLNPRDQRSVIKKIDNLSRQNRPPFEGLRVAKLSGFKPDVFALHATTDIRILFRYGPDHSIEILDVVRHERIRRLHFTDSQQEGKR